MKKLIMRWYESILAWEASLFRSRYNGPVIGIAGSVGKTSTKDAIALLIRKAYGEAVIVTPKSLNAQLGVPLTLFGYQATPTSALGWLLLPIRGLLVALWGKVPQCMVIEIGEEMPGDLAYLGRIVRPTHLVMTSTSEAHSTYFPTVESVRDEFVSLFEFLALDGVAIVNADDPVLSKLAVRKSQTKVSVSIHKRSDYFVSSIKLSLDGTEGILHRGNRTQKVRIERYGAHQLYSVLYAAAVADSLAIPYSVQQEAFKQIKAVAGRGLLIEGKRHSYILDESYNAQPEAMALAIEALAAMPAKKRVLILGDMRELKNPEIHHQEIGRLAHKVGDYIIGVGPLSKLYKPNEWFLTADEAVASALRQLDAGVIVLVKGSQNTIRLEKVVKSLMAHPEQAKKLLVRQGDEWANRP